MQGTHRRRRQGPTSIFTHWTTVVERTSVKIVLVVEITASLPAARKFQLDNIDEEHSRSFESWFSVLLVSSLTNLRIATLAPSDIIRRGSAPVTRLIVMLRKTSLRASLLERTLKVFNPDVRMRRETDVVGCSYGTCRYTDTT